MVEPIDASMRASLFFFFFRRVQQARGPVMRWPQGPMFPKEPYWLLILGLSSSIWGFGDR